MVETLNITVAQNPAHIDGPDARIEWLHQTLTGHQDEGSDILILPELFLSGYNIGAKTNQFAEPKNGTYATKIAALAHKYKTAITYGFPEKDGGATYNASNFIDENGTILATHRKLILPPGFESNHFSTGNTYTNIHYRGFSIAILICYDAEFPETFRAVAMQGADLVIVPTALGSDWGVVAQKVIPTRAFENGVYVAYANQAGNENGMDYHGGSCIIAPDGTELARARDTSNLIKATISKQDVQSAQSRLPYHSDLTKLP